MMTSILECFSMFMVMFEYEENDVTTKLIGVRIKGDNCKRNVYFYLTEKLMKENPNSY